MIQITEELKNLIENNALAFATVDEERTPHCIAVGFAKVYGDRILVTDNFINKSIVNLKNNKNVALAVWSRNWEDNCKGYELKGDAEYCIDGEWYEIIKKMPENKGFPAKGAILITVNEIKKLA